MDFNILYEDNHILVVVKPHNISVQEDSSKDPDMLTLLKQYLKEKYNKPGNVYLGLVHRLDRPTGGVMVFAKTSKAASRLSEQIRDGEVDKDYLTVVVGNVREKVGSLVHFLKKDEKNNVVTVVPQLETGSKRAELSYNVLEEVKDKITLVRVHLETGRSHQIRVQMATMGNPVFGDVKYGGDSLAKGWNLALWAYSLKFTHPVTKQTMHFIAYPNTTDTPWKFFNLEKYIDIKKQI